MSFLDRLFGKRPVRPDPTLAWGDYNPPLPDFDVTQMSLGSLRLGDTFDAAAFLGRPTRFEWTHDGYGELFYASGGFQIDYLDGRLAYFGFFIGPDEFVPQHSAFEFSKPRLRGDASEGIRLSSETNRAMLERIFGEADSVDSDPLETIIHYTRQNVTMEFEMDGATGCLKRWNMYPKDEAA